MEYIVPEYSKRGFTCPHCGVIAEQKWSWTYIYRGSRLEEFSFTYDDYGIKDKSRCKEIAVSTCNFCHNEHFWFEKTMLLPKVSNVPLPIDEMPSNVKDIFNEARDVFGVSPKAATALLRLALQHLCIALGGDGQNINNDIGELVKKGLPVEIQQALDVVRVAGNNAIHPGVLDLEDDSTSAGYLFNIINIIVENRVVQPKKIEQFYNALPKGALNAINTRDK